MLLHCLADYGRRLDAEDGTERLPPMYQRVPVRYIIKLDREGRLRGVPHTMTDTLSDQAKRGTSQIAPTRIRTSGIVPKLLVDNAEYVLGISREGGKEDRVRQQHQSFMELVRRCETETREPAVSAVVHFFTTFDPLQIAFGDDFDPSANIAFDVDGINPTRIASVEAFWAREASSSGDDSNRMPCLVCGQIGPVADMLPVLIKGIPAGQSTGMALVSANAKAFESYGLLSTHTSPICEECGLLACNALNRLLRQDDTHLVSGELAYVFWTREPVDMFWGTLLSNPAPDEVRRFLSAAWRATAADAALDTMPFYAAALSAANARVVVRDWIETTLDDAQRNLRRYFRLQRLSDGAGLDHYVPFWQLQRATVNANSQKEKAAPQVGQALMHVALHGGPMPEWLLYQAVRRTRAEQSVSPAQAALIKMVLLTQHPETGGVTDVTETNNLVALDTSHPDTAYHCGRLLAELEAIQRAALGDGIGATIVDRYFGTASSAPASVFGRLMRGAQPHLSKLHRDKLGLWTILDRRLQEITSHIDQFPRTLELREQGLFALGYYHQRTADSRDRIERKQAREAKIAVGIAGQIQGEEEDEEE